MSAALEIPTVFPLLTVGSTVRIFCFGMCKYKLPLDTCIHYTPPFPNIRKFREDEQLCIRVLSRWSRILECWRKLYEPAKDGDVWDLRFVEATKELSTISRLDST